MRFIFTLLSLLFVTFSFADNPAYLGVKTNQISKNKAKILGFDNPHGSYISKVIGNTAAEKAGLQAFDYIIAINDQELSRDRKLGNILRKYDAGEEVSVHFYRQGKKMQKMVKLGSRGDRDYDSDEDEEEAFLGINKHKDNKNNDLGVKVNIINHSTAHEMGLMNGDLITHINGTKMVDWSDINTAINNLKPGEPITVNYQRAGNEFKKVGTIRSYKETNEIREEKKRNKAFLGINYSTLSKAKAKKLGFDNPYGSYVTSVIKNTAAEKAGVQAFDYIYGIDEYRAGESQSLGTILSKYSAGDEAELHLIRKSQIEKLAVTFGRKSDKKSSNRDKCDDPFFGIQKSHKAPAENGIRVTIVKNSTAKELGLQNGDVIKKINGYKMVDWDDISAAINQLQVGDDITVDYERNGQAMKGTKPIKSYCDTKGKNQLNFDQNWDFSFNWDDDDDRPRRAEMRDISGIEVEMQDMSKEELEQMRNQHGVEMPTVNNLKIEALQLYPNPNEGLFNLSFELPEREETLIRIYNEQARAIYEYELGEFSGDFSDQVDISQNGTGTYFLEIRQGKKAMTQKIILKK